MKITRTQKLLLANEREVLSLLRRQASSCAGVGQDIDDLTLCGECDACEAFALLHKLSPSREG
jgi:hypothetical protein